MQSNLTVINTLVISDLAPTSGIAVTEMAGHKLMIQILYDHSKKNNESADAMM